MRERYWENGVATMLITTVFIWALSDLDEDIARPIFGFGGQASVWLQIVSQIFTFVFAAAYIWRGRRA